uniref:Uncharacterized protein n=1 Tax=Meloidogyne floridensis TaxID=298350 RepID=A0A915NKU2_9BILA
EQQQMEGQQQQILNPQVNELLDRTGQMRLDGRRPPMRPTFQRNGNGALIRVNNKRHSSLIPLATSPQNNPLVVPKNEIDTEQQKIIKQEAIAPPPSYQELSAVRGGIIGGENNNNNGGTSLPFDLESVNAMPVDQQAFADLDVDAVLRHELAQGGQFDLP